MYVTTDDGLRLNVTVSGPEGAPVLLAVHGYPDSSSLWDGVARELGDRVRFARYDVRGAGGSSAPRRTRDYALAHLVADLRSVADAVSPGQKVHLLAHDWGAIQGWHAVTADWAPGRIASYTAVSGAHLDAAAAWLRTGGRDAVRQARHSWYIGLFKTPLLPELAWRTGAMRLVLARKEGREVAREFRRSDGITGLKLYRANMRRPGRPPAPVDIPVQLVMPRGDAYVTPALQRAMPATTLVESPVEGRHWVPRSDPALIAKLALEHLERCA